MDTGIYVSLSGQLTMEKRLETIAQNIANATTAGYRASGVDFSTIVSHVSPLATEFSSTGENFVNEQSGGFRKTGGTLDVAVQGNGYLSFESPQGVFFSRDGRLTMQPDGQLASVAGHPVLDGGGGPVIVDPQGGPLTIGRDGSILQNGSRRGVLGLFAIDLRDGFSRFENSGLIPVQEPELMTSFTANGFLQGYIEESNVNPINEMVRLIEVTRAFEGISALSERAQDAQRAAIQALASR
ncbi:MAG: flagellar basal-body rod protein FlgF [Rhizobiales bacterium]|nr:flagellar basal-body rod protein FlgF [Hyphomicrobiales bacterium]